MSFKAASYYQMLGKQITPVKMKGEIVSPEKSKLHDYAVRWVFIFIVAFSSNVCLIFLGVRIKWSSLFETGKIAFALLLFAFVYTYAAHRIPRFSRPMSVVADFLMSVLQTSIAIAALIPLTYISAAAGFPLRDADLSSLDATIFGFDWDAASAWVADHPLLDRVLTTAYIGAIWQIAFVLLIGSISHPGQRNSEFIWHFLISIVITCAVFVFTPALGKVGHIGYEQIDVLNSIRNGLWNTLDYTQMAGIINFPSFHTTLALLLLYAVRHHRWLLVLSAPFDVLVIASTPTVGGHYLVDLPAGAVVAVLGIATARILRRRRPERANTPTTALRFGL